MDLFDSTSTVALPISVSDEVGNTNVPLFKMLLIVGDVRVLLVRVCAAPNVTTTSEDVPSSGIYIVWLLVALDASVVFIVDPIIKLAAFTVPDVNRFPVVGFTVSKPVPTVNIEFVVIAPENVVMQRCWHS